MAELANRPLLGWPGSFVSLDVTEKQNTVTVITPKENKEFVTTSRLIAKDWYFHPFVFGLVTPEDLTTAAKDDGA
jgi:hypothetical protein